MIPVEAVEAAAKVMLDHLYSDKTLEVDDEDRDMMRASLEAAAPCIRAQALEEAAKELKDGLSQDWVNAKWLRSRAAAERGGE